MSATSLTFWLLSIYYLSTNRCLGNNIDIAKSGPEMNVILIAIDWAVANLQPRHLHLCFVS